VAIILQTPCGGGVFWAGDSERIPRIQYLYEIAAFIDPNTVDENAQA
jgi:hypothetical protein